MKNDKKKILSLLAAIAAVMIAADILVIKHIQAKNMRDEKTINLPIYNSSTISDYDGTDPAKPTLIAMDGLVYDVSAGRDAFYAPGQPYHELAGKDSSTLLKIAGGAIIKSKYPVVGRYEK